MMHQSLQLAHRLQECNVLLIGGGEVALTRLPKLLPTGCKLTVIAPDLHKGIASKYPDVIVSGVQLNDQWNSECNQIYRVVNNNFVNEFLDLEEHWQIILVCISDHKLSREIYNECIRRYGPTQLINVADVPPLCNFYFGANLNLANDKLQVLVSSNGVSPRFSALVRDQIAHQFEEHNDDIAISIEKLGLLREQVRLIANTHADIPYRMAWIKNITDTYGWQHCNSIDVPKLTALFQHMYTTKTTVLPPKEVMWKTYIAQNEPYYFNPHLTQKFTP